jgi:hypothetical protein
MASEEFKDDDSMPDLGATNGGSVSTGPSETPAPFGPPKSGIEKGEMSRIAALAYTNVMNDEAFKRRWIPDGEVVEGNPTAVSLQ